MANNRHCKDARPHKERGTVHLTKETGHQDSFLQRFETGIAVTFG